MNYLKLSQIIWNKEQNNQYSDEYGHEYISLCDLRCANESIRDVYRDAKNAGAIGCPI